MAIPDKKTEITIFKDVKTTPTEFKGFLPKTEGTLTIFDREATKVKLQELVDKHKERLEYFKDKESLTDDELEELKGIKKELQQGRLFVEKIEKNNNDILNKVKKDQTGKNGELVKVIEPHESVADLTLDKDKTRRETEEKNRKDAIKKNAEDGAKALTDGIAKMTFATMDADEKALRKIVSEQQGTFDEYDVYFDLVADEIDTLILDRRTVLEAAEKSRVTDLENKIKTIEFDVKEIIFEATDETMDADDIKVTALLKTKGDFAELQQQFDDKIKSLNTLWTNTKTRLTSEAEQKKTSDNALETLQTNLYDERAKRLTEIGMNLKENGDFQVYDLTYTKGQIIADNAEIYANTVGSIQTFIDTESKKTVQGTEVLGEEILTGPGPIAPVTEELKAEATETVSKFEQAIADVAEKNTSKDNPTTVGELRELLAAYTDEMPISFESDLSFDTLVRIEETQERLIFVTQQITQ